MKPQYTNRVEPIDLVGILFRVVLAGGSIGLAFYGAGAFG